MTKAAPKLFRIEALCRATATRPDLVRRLAKASIIECAGQAGDKSPLYTGDATERVSRVRELLNAGYPEKDVAVVLGLIAHAQGGATRVFLTLGELVPAPRDPKADLARAPELASLGPDATRDDGEPLYLATRADHLTGILDLLHLGLDDLAQRTALKLKAGPLPAKLATEINAALLSRKQAAARVIQTMDRIIRGRPPRRWRGPKSKPPA